MEKDQLHMMMEFALDIRLFGPTLDRIGREDKKELFEAMKEVYSSLGSRLDSLQIVNFKVDWLAHVHFAIDASAAPGALKITCHLLRQTVTVPAEVLAGDPGPYTNLRHNSSRYSAALETGKDTYTLNTFFPRLSRSLLRRPSDVVGAVGAAVANVASGSGSADMAEPGAEVDEEAPPPPASAT